VVSSRRNSIPNTSGPRGRRSTCPSHTKFLSRPRGLPSASDRSRSSGSSMPQPPPRSEEHTSELQSPCNLVCRLLLEKKNKAQPLSPVADTAIWAQQVDSGRRITVMIVPSLDDVVLG